MARVFDRFRAATPSQQMQIIVAGVCLIGALLVAVWFSLFRTVYQPLFSGLRTMDAATITGELDREKIPYQLADGDSVILVPAGLVDKTRLNIMSDDVPLKGTVGFELFNKSDMGLTDFAQKIDYQRALQGELERTIMTLDGVEMVRVHLSLGEDHLFRDDRVKPKASVTIRMAKGAELSGSAAQGITRLVAGAVPKLDPSNVVILDEFGRVVTGAPQAVSPAAPGSPMQQEEVGIEEYYEAIIRSALVRADIPPDIAVNVAADVGSATNPASGTSGLPAWNPATRDFPLSVTLSPASPLGSEEQQLALTLVAQTIATATHQSDIIRFGLLPVDQPVQAVNSVPAAYAKKSPPPLAPLAAEDSGHDLLMALGAAAVLVFMIIIGFGLLLRRLRRPRRLTVKERTDFAAKLRSILEEREGHAVSNS